MGVLADMLASATACPTAKARLRDMSWPALQHLVPIPRPMKSTLPRHAATTQCAVERITT